MLSLFSPEIVNLIAPDEYKNAYLVISILSFYFVVQMYYFMTSSVLFYIEKATKFVSIATITSFILNIILNYFNSKTFFFCSSAQERQRRHITQYPFNGILPSLNFKVSIGQTSTHFPHLSHKCGLNSILL